MQAGSVASMQTFSQNRLSARSRGRPAKPVTMCVTLPADGAWRRLTQRALKHRVSSSSARAPANNRQNASGSWSASSGASATAR